MTAQSFTWGLISGHWPIEIQNVLLICACQDTWPIVLLSKRSLLLWFLHAPEHCVLLLLHVQDTVTYYSRKLCEALQHDQNMRLSYSAWRHKAGFDWWTDYLKVRGLDTKGEQMHLWFSLSKCWFTLLQETKFLGWSYGLCHLHHHLNSSRFIPWKDGNLGYRRPWYVKTVLHFSSIT